MPKPYVFTRSMCLMAAVAGGLVAIVFGLFPGGDHSAQLLVGVIAGSVSLILLVLSFEGPIERNWHWLGLSTVPVYLWLSALDVIRLVHNYDGVVALVGATLIAVGLTSILALVVYLVISHERVLRRREDDQMLVGPVVIRLK